MLFTKRTPGVGSERNIELRQIFQSQGYEHFKTLFAESIVFGVDTEWRGPAAQVAMNGIDLFIKNSSRCFVSLVDAKSPVLIEAEIAGECDIAAVSEIGISVEVTVSDSQPNVWVDSPIEVRVHCRGPFVKEW